MTTMAEIIDNQKNSHTRWLLKRFEQLEEDRKQGRREVYMPIEELQTLLMEIIGLHQRLERTDDTLGNYATLYFNSIITKPPSGTQVGT